MAAPNLRDFILHKLRSQPREPGHLRFSLAGKPCVREVYYQVTGAPAQPEADEGLVRMALGTAFDKYLLDGRYADFCMASQVPVSLTIGEVTVTGHADAVFYDGDIPVHVADLKTVGPKTWAKVEKAPKQEHVSQVLLYAWALGARSWSVCYVHDGQIREHSGEVDDFSARREFSLLEDAAYWLKRDEPPPRPYEDHEDEQTGEVKLARNAFPCSFCRFHSTCWSESEVSDVTVSAT